MLKSPTTRTKIRMNSFRKKNQHHHYKFLIENMLHIIGYKIYNATSQSECNQNVTWTLEFSHYAENVFHLRYFTAQFNLKQAIKCDFLKVST